MATIESGIKAGAARSAPPQSAVQAEPEQCNPFWNFRARWILFYLYPLTLLILVIAYFAGLALYQHPTRDLVVSVWDGLNTRNFWVPLLWGVWMPWFNGPNGPVPGLKRIVFRNFSGNVFLPLAVPLLHGLVWLACSQLPLTSIGRPLAFAAIFLCYDYLLLRSDLLQIYGGKFAAGTTPGKTLKSRLPWWWLYLGCGLELVNQFGSDAPIAVLASAVLLFAPMQLMLFRIRLKPVTVRANRVAVIGAGWSGLYAAKWLAQAGLDVKVYEQTERIGGPWNIDENMPGAVADSTFESSSVYYMHASDYPMQSGAFPSQEEILDFINSYADRFDMRSKVSLNARVKTVQKEGAQWVLGGVTGSDDTAFEDRFDAVVVASGLNGEPRNFDERYAGFSGEVMHGSRYRRADCLGEQRRIIVVGLGESAADVAHECARLPGKTVYMSGDAQWFLGRFVGDGLPADTFMAPGLRALTSRFLDFERRGCGIVEDMISSSWGPGGSGINAWVPQVPWPHSLVTRSRVAVDDVHAGKIIARTRIAGCDGKQVTFTDGTTVEADLIIDCSGFAPDFPFLPKQVALADLHRLVFDRDDPTLSFVGTARPVLGSIPALAEMQARYIAAVYSGRVRLPHPNEQEMDGFYAARQHRKRFLASSMRPNLVDHEIYAADIARNTGVTVPWIRILLRSRKQFKMLLQAPWMAFKYELRGDHSARAMEHIAEHMPQEPEYYQIIKKRFAKPLKMMWTIQAVTLASILTLLPFYLVVTLALGLLAQQLLRSRTMRKARIT